MLRNVTICSIKTESSLKNKDCVASQITNLLIVNPLTVAYSKSKKPRLVLEYRHINPHLHKYRFNYEDEKIAREKYDVGDFIFSSDLKSAYNHIEILEELQQYFDFARFEGEIRYLVFAFLPFGFSIVCYIFSKVFREVVEYFRSKDKITIIFLDDGLAGKNHYDIAV